jgi:hypothetical protein
MKIFILISLAACMLSCENRRSKAHFEGSDTMSASEVMLAKAESPNEQTSVERKLIRTGSLAMTVGHIEKARTEIAAICKDYDAYISSEVQTEYDDRREYEQVIRIPATSFDDVLRKIEGVGDDVKSKNIQTSDVTEEFIDKEARIKTKKELENRYLEILKQARDVSDILSIEAQLNNVRAEIESLEGRLNYLKNQVAFSTLSLRFYQPVGADFGFGSKTVAALGNGWDMLLVFVIGILHIWPFVLIIFVITFLISQKNRFRKKISRSDID